MFFFFTKRDSLPKRIDDFFSEDFLNDEVVLDVVAGRRAEEETVEDTEIKIIIEKDVNSGERQITPNLS